MTSASLAHLAWVVLQTLLQGVPSWGHLSVYYTCFPEDTRCCCGSVCDLTWRDMWPSDGLEQSDMTLVSLCQHKQVFTNSRVVLGLSQHWLTLVWIWRKVIKDAVMTWYASNHFLYHLRSIYTLTRQLTRHYLCWVETIYSIWPTPIVCVWWAGRHRCDL